MVKKFTAGLSFSEAMSGYLDMGSSDPRAGERRGREGFSDAILDNHITIDNVRQFKETATHEAALKGTFTYAPLGVNMDMVDGKFNLFIIDNVTGDREMLYKFAFTADNGKQYFFYGVKYIEQKMYGFRDPFEPLRDMTTLFTQIHEGNSVAGKVVAAGIIRFHLKNLPELGSSIKIFDAPNRFAEKRAVVDFFGFVLGQLGATYLPMLFPEYTKIENEYDAVVVGSGFGGAATAYMLAKEGKSVCLLERGKHWRGNTNVRHIRDLYRMFRTPIRNGLLDYRVFKKMQVLQANGVGGGSLIYANVIIKPNADLFEKDWPEEITLTELEKYYPHVDKMLGVRKASVPPLKQLFPKTEALHQGAKATPDGKWDLLNLAINDFEPDKFKECKEEEKDPSSCRACGKCVIVCNRSAKNTVDLNYIKDALENGAELFAEHELTEIEPINGGADGYEVVYHDLRNNVYGKIRAKKLILAAGALGSTEILLKARNEKLPNLSNRLGDNFSGNGDFLSFTVNSQVETQITLGPTITSFIDYRSSLPAEKQFIVEEGGIPSPLAPIANTLIPFLNEINSIPKIKEIITNFMEPGKKDFGKLIKDIAKEAKHDIKENIWDFFESLLKKPVNYSQMYLSMGRDASDGKMTLKNGKKLDIAWDPAQSMPLFDEMEKKLRIVSEDGIKGTYEPFPLWSLLKILITVHPLGGCKMGTTVDDGVVDANGEVFNYPNLYVSDGSIIPKALGVNPAMTITALAERNAVKMVENWK